MIYILLILMFAYILSNINFKNELVLKNILKRTLYYNDIHKQEHLIIYKTFKGCGLGNKIPTIISCIFFSIVSSSSFYIFGWKEMKLYFKIPLYLINNNISFKNIVEIRKINYTIKNIFNYYKKISIYKYHGFMNIIYNLYNDAKIIKNTKKNVREWNRIIQQVFFQPCDIVNKYLLQFQHMKSNTKVIAVHIRTGFLSNLSKTSIWYSPIIYKKYISVINKLISQKINYKLLIISDSQVMIEILKKQFYSLLINYSIPGPINDPHGAMHGGNFKTAIKLLTDNFLISKCEIAIGSHASTYFKLACSRSNVACYYL